MTPVGFHGPRLPAGSCESRSHAHFGTSWFPEPQEAPMAPGSWQTLAIPGSRWAPKNPGFLLSPASGLLLCTQAFEPPQHKAASHNPRLTCHPASLVSRNLQTRPANLGSQPSLWSGQPHSPSIQTSSQGFRLLAGPRARQDPTDQTSRLTPEVIGWGPRLWAHSHNPRLQSHLSTRKVPVAFRPAPVEPGSWCIIVPEQPSWNQTLGPSQNNGTYLAHEDPRFRPVHADPVLRPITTDSITRPTPVNPGSRPTPANRHQVCDHVPKYQSCPPDDPGTRSAYPRMSAASSPANITQNL